MLKLRLKRYGKKNNPIYNLGIMLATTKRNGLAIKNIGFYNPKTKNLKFNVSLIVNGLQNGVYPTATIKYLLTKINILV